ncbi:MAG TPA: TetR/AcrR family transcriptional regulator [Oligoflexus sp.]|uniref:TetR/AcrR family transcriptional regulator n=1 Tax=Oligoflexus sp. TaxID=1971216 RepID=UPI002D53F5AA|nr:TetR/AcrR family transcriptional regulator [Oligoflexus sp.]HYX37632.1 TetR/AcrR family transcriptional regulator [Oligoflexus sp.]
MKIISRLIQEGLISDPESPRGRIIHESSKLFAERGFEKTTVRDIAAAVGIQSGSLFHHFKVKEDILKAIMEEAVRVCIARQEEAVAGVQTPHEKLRMLIRSELETIHGPTGRSMSILVMEWRSISESNQRELLTLREHYERFWFQVLEENAEALAIDDVVLLRRLLSGSLSWSTYWYRNDGDTNLDQLADYCLALALKKPLSPKANP